jgi:hypothetical protein
MSRCSGLLEEVSADHLHWISDICYRLVKDHCITLPPPIIGCDADQRDGLNRSISLTVGRVCKSRATLLPNLREIGIAERLNDWERTLA